MANVDLFSNLFKRKRPALATDAVNAAGGAAYQRSDAQALAQYVATGCLSNTFYASAKDQLAELQRLALLAPAPFVARAAVYAREQGFMKDTPALLLAVLASRDGALFEAVFHRICDNGKMLRNFVQIVRSGATGRRSLGSRPKRAVQRWLKNRSDAQLLAASVGDSPSLADIVKMVHPLPDTPARRALYAWLLGRDHATDELPAAVREFEDFKAGRTRTPPDLPFQLLTARPLDKHQWRTIAERAPWQMTRMNLNTFLRHEVFDDPKLTRKIAQRLASPEQIQRARAFPYQLLMAYKQADPKLPRIVREALQDAMEAAIANVPAIDGKVYLLPDVSGSMHSPVTGRRKGATTQVRCIDVAALVAAAFLRRNRDAELLPFHDRVLRCELKAAEGVMKNAATLAGLPSGGTDCSVPLRTLNERRARGDLVIFISDNESWIDAKGRGRATGVMREWEAFRARNPRAKLVCIDVQPSATVQAPDRPDILNVGGFSDAVFELVAAFARGGLGPDHWVGVIDALAL
ncbi:TROVE domain-containing protein [Nannocystis sp.]|uniref:TROVE domain-containing protein n=1 Tax=Nannocystis sp. TaxID=1962667 RepID=UPI0025F9017E|nr:TROVE domain-containing protein [Nannocystis sp.]MBK7824759.1 TROVE domain-containing protein [Nannocystis sp.]